MHYTVAQSQLSLAGVKETLTFRNIRSSALRFKQKYCSVAQASIDSWRDKKTNNIKLHSGLKSFLETQIIVSLLPVEFVFSEPP